MKIEIRNERKEEEFEVENLVRESFWNVYRPGCSEHLILHNYRKDENYVEDLSKVITLDGKIIGQIMFSEAEVRNKNTKEIIKGLTFGPICILPQFQKLGLGEKLISYTIEKAKKARYPFIIIFGSPDYYHKYGFITAKDLGIFIEKQKEDDDFPFVMIKVLDDEYTTIFKEQGTWIYKDPEGYKIDLEELEAFDKKFPKKIKEKREGQLE